MNHSRAFWAVRNQYADRMRELWSRSYTGEGLWGRGALLSTGEFERNGVQPGETLPEHLCGGTYRSRGKKRKAEKVLSYQEQKEKRILKKFGANGVALGEDVAVKRKLEKGRTVSAKPRVAGSARGRELRAAAALARFDEQKKEEVEVLKIDNSETESGSEGEYEDDEVEIVDAVDLNGKRMVDGKGRGLIRICEDESPDDADAQKELLELQGFSLARRPKAGTASASSAIGGRGLEKTTDVTTRVRGDGDRQSGMTRAVDQSLFGSSTTQKSTRTIFPLAKKEAKPTAPRISEKQTGNLSTLKPAGKPEGKSSTAKPTVARPPEPKDPPAIPGTTNVTCPVCSFANDRMAPTCGMCSNVLHIKSMPGAWACGSQACRGSIYRNAADCGVCGVCGEHKGAAA
jgi:DNA-dependent metalloprotease WSS1